MTPGPCEPFPLIISEAIAAVTAEDLNIGGSVLSDDTDGEETVSLESADVVTDLPRQPEPEATAGDVVVKLAGQVSGSSNPLPQSVTVHRDRAGVLQTG